MICITFNFNTEGTSKGNGKKHDVSLPWIIIGQ